MITKIFFCVASFLSMEVVAHLMHKYVMHGFLWVLHKSHHQKGRGFFEKNDLYFLIFAIPGIAFLFTGLQNSYDWKFFFGLGITLYGFTYLLVHDIIIHQRFKWFAKLDNGYIKAIKRAHKAHHADVNKSAAVSYGMLWIDRKYFDKAEIPSLWKGQNVLF